MMRGDLVFAQPVGQLPRQTLGHLARVHEHEGRAVLANQCREAVVIFRPHVMRHHRFEWRRRQLDREIDVATMALINHRAIGNIVREPRAVPTRKRATASTGRCVADKPMRSGGRPCDRGQPLERQRQVSAAPRTDHRVNLVDDHGAHVRQTFAASFRRQQQVKRFRRGHEDMRRRLAPSTRACAGEVSPVRTAEVITGASSPISAAIARMPLQRLGEVLVDVAAQRLERRNVDDPRFFGQRMREAFAQQIVDGTQKGGQRLTGSGGRRDERVAAGADRCPSGRLRRPSAGPASDRNHRSTAG